MKRLRAEDGSILPLIAFAAAFALALTLTVVAATSFYLERKRLLTLADGAALVGAEAFELGDVDVTGPELSLELDDAAVAEAVQDYVSSHDTFTALTVERAESLDGRSATVELSAYWRPPLLTLFVPEGIRLDVEVTARSLFG
jgi:hypothetical protein